MDERPCGPMSYFLVSSVFLNYEPGFSEVTGGGYKFNCEAQRETKDLYIELGIVNKFLAEIS
jgi:hypothetical protein